MVTVAPVVIFVHNRFNQFVKAVSALEKCKLASQTVLYIYSDGPKQNIDENDVNLIRDYSESISGFKEVNIFKSEDNKGLRRNIEQGITEVVNEHGKVIVLEEDLCMSSMFLLYMNEALDMYQDHKNVWHINGYNEVVPGSVGGYSSFTSKMFCWGWATWSDRWNKYEHNVDLFHELSRREKHELDMEGFAPISAQLKENFLGLKNTWAIYWAVAIYRNKGLCLTPHKSYISNEGFIEQGHTHSNDLNTIHDFKYVSFNVMLPKIIRLDKKYERLIRNSYLLQYSRQPIVRFLVHFKKKILTLYVNITCQ